MKKDFKIIPWEEGMEPESGCCYSGMPNDDYHHKFIDWFSSSDLKNAVRSYEYFWQEVTRKKNQEEREEKVAFDKGLAFHDAIESLVDHGDLRLFEQNTIPYAGTSQAKAAYLKKKAANPGKNVVPQEYFENVPVMAQRAKDEADFLNIFGDGGHCELAFFWIDPITKTKLKIKTDYSRLNLKVLIDFKSTKSHVEKEFSKDLANFNYHFSMAMYCEGILQVAGVLIEEVVLITVNNTAPFETAFYTMTNSEDGKEELRCESLEQGDTMFREALATINRKKKPDPEFKKISIPGWAMTRIEKKYYGN